MNFNSISILGCGWLGLKIGIHFISRGKEVWASNRNNINHEKLADSNIKSCIIDLSSKPAIINKEFFKSEILITSISPKGNEQGYIESYEYLCNFLSKENLNPKIIQLSSIGVYKDLGGICTENSPTKENHLAIAEQKILNHSSNSLVLRLSGLYGEGRNPAHFFKSDEITNANWPINLIESSEAIEAIEMAIDHDLKGIYNLCNENHPSRGEFYNQYRQKIGLPKLICKNNELEMGKIISAHKFMEACKQTKEG